MNMLELISRSLGVQVTVGAQVEVNLHLFALQQVAVHELRDLKLGIEL